MITNKGKVYTLTVQGFLKHELGEQEGKRVFDALELYVRRRGVGIAIENNRLSFVELVPVEEPPKSPTP